MKKSILFFFVLLIGFGFLAYDAFAAAVPVPGIDVVVRKKPSGKAVTTLTTNDGSFVSQLDTGSYSFSCSYTVVINKITSTNKKADPTKVVVYLSFEGAKDLMVNGRPYTGPIKITADFKELTVSTKQGGKVMGKLTYQY
jgi:hypothetical protein